MASAKKSSSKKSSKKSSSVVRVDFTGVEGKRSTLPDDDYLVEVESAELKDGNGDYQYIEVTSVVQSGKHKGGKVWDRLSLSPNSLWRLRSFLEVLGMEVPDDEMDVDIDEMIGCTYVVVTAQEKYRDANDQKKISVKVADFYPADDFQEKSDDDEDDDDDEDEKPKKKAKAGKKGKTAKDEDEDDDEDGDSDDDDDEDETPEERKKRQRKERRAARKAGKKSDDDDDEDEPKKKGKKSKKSDDDEDDDDDEDEKPKKKAKAGKKGKATKYSADAVNDADEEGLGDIIEESGIEVDLDDYKTLRKKQAAVIDALETADLLEEDDE